MLSWPNRYKQLLNQCKTKPVHDFYQRVVDKPSMPIGEVPMVALDFETTGLDYLNNDIVSVGLVPFNTQRIRCRDSQQWLVKPRQTLAEDSIVIHGITHSEVNQAPDFSEIITPLLTALSGKVIVVHFAAVERHFLYHALKERLNEGLEFAVIDTMELEKRALKARQGLLGRVLNQKLDSVRLADSRSRYSLPAYNNHNALTDALATAELLQAQLAYHYRIDTPLSDLWV
ncbi:DNA polymerase III subunit epsilon [Pseudoalteromonas sp. KS88]|uniref:3'-5' exonuclease n=1 Tax=Pseudoalteromonas sp. KS88 TaxID=2109918 RepID=UPI0010822B32|nr:3'-5' exonuclease [Pseudoalteromonas sp. KS88]TGE85928.1 DNA polymerase III subunit epsilon [Pseudoalteromonas sp. KS88]